MGKEDKEESRDRTNPEERAVESRGVIEVSSKGYTHSGECENVFVCVSYTGA